MGCRRVAPVSELIRVTAAPDGGVIVGRHRPGRGAWLCAGSADCLAHASMANRLSRALRTPVTTAAVDALRAQL